MSDSAKWTCPKCATVNAPDFTQCRKCGEHSPATPVMRTCEKCGITTDRNRCPSCNSTMFVQL